MRKPSGQGSRLRRLSEAEVERKFLAGEFDACFRDESGDLKLYLGGSSAGAKK